MARRIPGKTQKEGAGVNKRTFAAWLLWWMRLGDNMFNESDESKQYFVCALRQLLGSKRYLNDLEALLTRLGDLSAEEWQTLRYLAHDLRDIKDNSSKFVNKFRPFLK
jgi:hypothetical protein